VESERKKAVVNYVDTYSIQMNYIFKVIFIKKAVPGTGHGGP
jgi:hypothetical protein